MVSAGIYTQLLIKNVTLLKISQQSELIWALFCLQERRDCCIIVPNFTSFMAVPVIIRGGWLLWLNTNIITGIALYFKKCIGEWCENVTLG